MNNLGFRWEVLEKAKVKDIIPTLLRNRGITSKKDKEEFFKPTPAEKISVKALGVNPKEIAKAITRIKLARKTQEKVIVYGDYDADGICGTAILWEALFTRGLNVLPHIPERFTEGYGLNVESIKKLKKEDENLGLIITVDHGIVANTKVDLARELGIDVIVTDHHEPAKLKPKTYALVHTTKISGSAVAWVLAREIGKKIKNEKPKLKDLSSLELAAIGTLADQLPLIGPNRSFAKYGLEALNKTQRVGLLALFKEAAIVPGEIGPYEVGFIIAPRINATGRLTHAIDSLRILCTRSVSRAQELAEHLGRTNLERQRIVQEVVVHARERLKGGVGESIIILAHESYHEGVIGLAAAKLVEEFYRPAIVLSKKGEISKASARSISGFNIIAAIRSLKRLYIEGGGHPMAAGFSIKTVKIQKFSKEINKLSKKALTPEILSKRIKIDTEAHFNQLNQALYDKIKAFEPTGLGNPAPVFITRDVEVLEARRVGKEGSHLKLRLAKDGINFEAIGFGLTKRFTDLGQAEKMDIVYCLDENVFNGRKSLQLKIKDIRKNA
ncbi:single-stranded-DNA-specific exonuclease RecJ [Candidatus Woesebacteria bacterium RBG_19FT_COMBO_47_8]|uniref:Single-stranded-DNA-specific exonuclease RecJ n=1 Tax=Candidatus Woesebacteria bacterium RBG_13_46_13 TaxID=1802479 RepID=A0A1F7X5C0_9BACT|nr:MAG: single-stranded-DNA-specific exonuclease RecJ [Candidatus Woesebacteria bacterium RBG_13_46_13]OGM16712.1 MAG: single-stranded-DNA-specific exonuclease RecJ [Candidatus Woesebacteria bacterium RBG_19FT_COMBO_47_8]HJX59114.1 single-stranded-DNA-specific exonuclease RecJ [Patescibacteria group bacterium]